MRKTEETRSCPFCLSPIRAGEETMRCLKCGAAHHADCGTTSGKCAIHGCEGSLAENSRSTEIFAPKIANKSEVTRADTETPKAQAPCISCGAPVEPNQIKCWECRRRSWPVIGDRSHFFDNCSGPALLFVCAVAGVVMLVVRAL